MKNNTHYVLGFMISTKGDEILLAQNKYGEYNGIGGSVQIDEDPQQAMARNFKRFTDIQYTGWIQRGEIRYLQDNNILSVFYAVSDVYQNREVTPQLVLKMLTLSTYSVKRIQNGERSNLRDDVLGFINNCLDSNLLFFKHERV